MQKKLLTTMLLCILISTNVYSANFERIGFRGGMQEIAMPGDGDCLFWATAAGDNAVEGKALTYGLPDRKIQLRQQVAAALKAGDFAGELNIMLASDDTPYHDINSYIAAVSNGMWAGDLELLVLSKLLNKNIIHHSKTGVLLTYPNDKPYSKTIHVWYTGSHYNLLLPKN